MQQLHDRFPHNAAEAARSQIRGFGCLQSILGMHDDIQANDADDLLFVGSALMIGNEGKSEIPAGHFFDVGHGVDIHFRDGSRFDDFHGDALPDQSHQKPAHDQAGAERGAASRTSTRAFRLSSSYPSRQVNVCNPGVNSSRPAFISNSAYIRDINSDLSATTNDSWRGKI